MSKFVKLTLHDGRACVFRIADIDTIVEPSPELAAAEFRTGCLLASLMRVQGPEKVWLIGTVDGVLAEIRTAENQGATS